MSRSTHLFSLTQSSTRFIKLGLMSGLHQLKSFLASHSITTCQTKKSKTIYKRLFLGYILPKKNDNMDSDNF